MLSLIFGSPRSMLHREYIRTNARRTAFRSSFQIQVIRRRRALILSKNSFSAPSHRHCLPPFNPKISHKPTSHRPNDTQKNTGARCYTRQKDLSNTRSPEFEYTSGYKTFPSPDQLGSPRYAYRHAKQDTYPDRSPPSAEFPAPAS